MQGHIQRSSRVEGSIYKARAALISVSSTVVLLTSLSALAENKSLPVAESTSGALAEIVVTAQKRSENAQDVPVSVTALSAADLVNRQIEDITDLQRQVPSMAVGQLYGANLITLRGISTGLTVGTEDASVAVHVNGVYQPRSRSLDVALMDLDRVEVLAGPQGTLYGRNATGGVVNYITKAPTKELSGEITGVAGNFKRLGVKGTLSGPITDRIGFRISGLWDDQRTGFTKNLLAGAPNDTLEAKTSKGGHVTLTFEPVDALKIDFDAMYLKTKTAASFSPFGPSNSAAVQTLLDPQSFRAHEIYTSYPNALDSKFGLYSLTVAWDISNDTQLKSISAFQTYEDDMFIDNAGSAFTAVAVHQKDDDHTFTQEFDLTTHSFSNRLTSIYGLYYFDDQIKIDTEVPFNIAPPPNFYIFSPNVLKAKSYAAFTDQTLTVTDRFRLIAGIRYNHDKKETTNGLSIPPFGVICAFNDSRTWSAWTPRVGAQYDITKDVMSYVGWQKGFKAGGFTANTCGNPFEPESIQGPEIGIKSELFDHHLRLNVAGYYYKYKNLQVQQEFGVGQFGTTNAAEAKIKGVEITARAGFDNGLSADLAMNLQSAKYTDFHNCNETSRIDACTTPALFALLTEDVSGNRLNRAPSYSVNLGVEYEYNIAAGSLLFRAETFHSGKVNYDEFDTPAMSQPAFNVQNLFLTFTSASQRYQVRGFVKNLGDKDYKIAAFFNSADGEPSGTWAPPRTYGGELTFKF
jgi:iron complex outermembrane recepter protein